MQRRPPADRADARRRRPWPLAAYFVVLVALVLAAALAAAAFLSVQADRDSRRAAHRNAEFAVTTASRRLGDSVADMRATVLGVAGTLVGKAIPSQLSASCSLTFSGADALPSGHVEIMRPDGLVVCSSRPHEGVSALSGYGGAPWLARALERPLFLAPVRDSATGRLAAVATAPVGSGAIVAAFADLRPIAGSLAALYGGGRSAEFLVVSKDGRTVLSRSAQAARWVGAPLPAAALPAPNGDEQRDLEGKSRIYEQAPVSGVGWRFYVGEDESAALAAGTSLRDRELWIILAGVVAVVFAALVIYRRVAVPIKRLGAAVRASEPHLSAAPVPVSGPAEVAALAGDINDLIASVDHELHERRRLEGQLRHAQKMDALGRVVAGVAHDFNNLVTVIAGFTGLIHGSLRRDDPLRSHAGEAANAADRARSLIRQLLVFSRNDPPEPQPFDANEVVAEMQGMLVRVLGSKVELTARLDAGPVVVEAGPGQLEQVVMNLAVNARDAMPDGGRLTLEVGRRGLDDARAAGLGLVPGDYAALCVADTGVGMDAATRERLFEPFFTTKEAGKGTGLGLATCYGIVSQLGGAIDVASEPGRGSTFTVYLPLSATAPDALPGTVAPEARRGKGETILVVEDDDGLRAFARIVLEEAGYAVVEADAAEHALSVAESHGPIDLLLTDGIMGPMTGRELSERFALRHPDSGVVYMSGYEPESLPPGSEVPAHAFLAKPFTSEALLAQVRATLDARGR
jgi:signal transduction histidine kinase